MFWNKYPYTDFHEMNLDWLLTTYQQIVEDIQNLQQWVTTHQGEYEAAMVRLAAVENEIDTFEQQIRQSFAELSAQIEAELAAQKAEVQQLIVDTRQELERTINEFKQEIAAIEAAFLKMISDMRAEINRILASIQGILEENNEYIQRWVEIRLQEFIESIPSFDEVFVYNPYRGETTLLQQAIDDLYTICRILGLTAAQYDSLQLTASEYDALGLTARDYDTIGYKLLFKEPAHYMFSPFTGLYERLQDVIMSLAALHMNALTASAYDALELEAQVYDGKELTAYTYDWNGAAVLP